MLRKDVQGEAFHNGVLLAQRAFEGRTIIPRRADRRVLRDVERLHTGDVRKEKKESDTSKASIAHARHMYSLSVREYAACHWPARSQGRP
jgi:hypothetical protein